MLAGTILGCKHEAPIIAEDVVVAADTSDASDASEKPETTPSDACALTETWEAKVVVRKTWHATQRLTLPGPLEVVVPRLHLRKTLYEDCGMTGGGCGDCTKLHDPARISCDLSPDHVRVDVGVDEVGPTFVDLTQRGDALVADWTEGGMVGLATPPKPTHRTETIATLPCSVKIRFVR